MKHSKDLGTHRALPHGTRGLPSGRADITVGRWYLAAAEAHEGTDRGRSLLRAEQAVQSLENALNSLTDNDEYELAIVMHGLGRAHRVLGQPEIARHCMEFADRSLHRFGMSVDQVVAAAVDPRADAVRRHHATA
ncbi:hypothetical protein [Allokutzneria sp. NRRL B-24872]|uniref:hypothetical protein n=1 Tax=Allokutzneria sp. NRRL B-24872 TaxID=1137961 RepID=UPI000A3CD6EE|nr:hypothetical protein [Allokutzneria sp. NRRL B-24872]